MTGEPPAAITFAEHVVAHATAGGRCVDDPIAADVNRDVVDTITVIGEEQQVPRPQRTDARRHWIAEIGHASRAVRKTDALAPKYPLHEARRIEAVVRTGAAGAEARPDILIRRSQHA